MSIRLKINYIPHFQTSIQIGNQILMGNLFLHISDTWNILNESKTMVTTDKHIESKNNNLNHKKPSIYPHNINKLYLNIFFSNLFTISFVKCIPVSKRTKQSALLAEVPTAPVSFHLVQIFLQQFFFFQIRFFLTDGVLHGENKLW